MFQRGSFAILTILMALAGAGCFPGAGSGGPAAPTGGGLGSGSGPQQPLSTVGRIPQLPPAATVARAPSPTLPGSDSNGGAGPTQLAGSGPAAPASGPIPVGGRSAFEQEVDRYMLEIINRERAKSGAGPVQFEPRLVAAAWKHCEDMYSRNYLDHQNPEGQWPWDRAAAAGFPANTDNCNENVGDIFNRQSARELAETAVWEYSQSDGHWKNLLDPKWNVVGLATVYRPDQAPRDSYGEPKIPNCQLFGRI